jgi:hypothetical protein
MNHPTTPGPWHAVEYAGYWNLQGKDYYSEHDDLLDEDKVGAATAKANALLAASAPQLKEENERLIRELDNLKASIPNLLRQQR